MLKKIKIKFIFEELQQANVTHSVEWPHNNKYATYIVRRVPVIKSTREQNALLSPENNHLNSLFHYSNIRDALYSSHLTFTVSSHPPAAPLLLT